MRRSSTIKDGSLALQRTALALATVIISAGTAVPSLAFAGSRHHSSPTGAQYGMASYYGPGFHGRRTASGERFNAGSLTAAHRTLPFGTRVRVTARNGHSIVVRINDRGPFTRGRIIDLSSGSARALGMRSTEPVSLVPLSRAD
jgi:rare lipoprotein A